MRYLLSMIGIGPYEKVRVHVPWSSAPADGEKHTYHQERLRKEIHADRLWLIGTEKALEAHSRQLSHARAIAIPPGLEEAEIWEIANQITSALGGILCERGPHEIHLDLTHGFRTQPMVMLSAVRYFCSLHSAEVVLEKVYYNCFERGNPHSTLIEMRPLLEMQAVASEIELLLAYGVANPLAARLGALLRQLKSEEASRFPELTKKARGQKMRESEEANPALGILKALFSQLQAFSAVIGINHTPCAARVVRALCELAESAEREFAREHKILRYLGRALGVMRVELQNLLPADANPLWGWHIALSRWCLKRGLVQQAITHATELIPTRCCEEAGLDPLDLKNRLAFGESVTALSPHISGERKPPRDWEPILQSWNSVREHRNRVNHSYTSGSTEGDPSADERKIQAAVEKLLRVVEATRNWPGCKIDFSPKNERDRRKPELVGRLPSVA